MTKSNSCIVGLSMIDVAIIKAVDKIKRKRIKRLKLKRNIITLIKYSISMIGIVASFISIINAIIS